MYESLERMIVYDGADPEYVFYHTPSWTRQGVEHDLWIDKETGIIHCRCEDGMCRHKMGHIFYPTGVECKHIRVLERMIWRVLN